MHITLNGHSKDIADRINLEALVEQCCDTHKLIVAEVNGTVIKKQEWPARIIARGDVIELVNFVGGG